jgi:Fe-S-cluster containining protein
MTSECRLFECTQCGDCCKGFGGTYVTMADIDAIADFIGVAPADLVKSYCSPSGDKLVLAQRADGFCIFWDRNCTIHPVKPDMCRKWPFISSLLVDTANWNIMASVCPGMRNDLDGDTLKTCIHRELGALSRRGDASH